MAPSTKPPPKRGRSILNTKIQGNKIEKRSKKSTALKKPTHEADILTHEAASFGSHHSAPTPSSSASNQWQPASQHSVSHSPTQERGSRSPPAYERGDSRELEFTPPIHPLTELNLQEHTRCTSPVTQSASTNTAPELSRSERLRHLKMTDLKKLTEYGVIMLDDNASQPAKINNFVRETVFRSRAAETPGAQKIVDILPRARNSTSESAATEMISTWLIFRESTHQSIEGEKFVSLTHEPQFNRDYVAHSVQKFSLGQPRPDRSNGEEEELIIRNHMAPVLHDESFFPWLTAEFKKAIGENITIATFQCARHGVGVNNYMSRFYGSADIVASMTETLHFSIACDLTTAILFVHWIGTDKKYYMQRAYSAQLSPLSMFDTKNEQMVLMRKYLRNILDWALGERLDRIRDAVRIVQQKHATTAAKPQAQAKGRQKGNTDQAAQSPRLLDTRDRSTAPTSTLENSDQSTVPPRRSARNKNSDKSRNGQLS